MNEGWESDEETAMSVSQESVYTNSQYKNNSFQNRTNDYNRGRNDSQRNSQGSWKDNRNRGERQGNKKDAAIVEIESSQIGMVIGRGGSMIRELEQNSGASLKIIRNDTGADLEIIGTPEAQQKAKELVENLLSRERGGNRRERNFHDNNDRNSETKREEAPAEFTTIDWQKANEEHAKFQAERWANLGPIVKDFYKEDPEVANMSEERVARIRQQNNNIDCFRGFDKEKESNDDFKIPNPVETFEQAFREYPEILEEIRKQGFEKPSPIQRQAWPILLKGKDLIGIAQTGTGKTLAFLLPALIHIEGQPTPRSERHGPTVLVIAPTRELAQQIEKEVSKYSYRGIRTVCLYGGGSRQQQAQIVSKGVEIVIAVPGRLNDFITTGELSVKSVTYLVLDEADRMLDMGFEPQIRMSLIDVRPDRQTVMTSATWPPGVRRMAQMYMKDPIQVYVGSLDLAAVHSVRQTIHLVSDEEKTPMLYEFFRNMGENDKVIVFFGKKSRVDDFASELALANVECQSIHGGREQIDREQALVDIKQGSVKILLATDVASRGIDIEDITHVFNYDFPRDIEEYVHRVGRTGRAGRTGESITLMTRGDWSHARELIRILEEASQEVPEGLYQMADRYDAMKERRAQEKERERLDGGSFDGGRRGGGSFNGGRRGGGSFGGERRSGGRDRFGGGGNRW